MANQYQVPVRGTWNYTRVAVVSLDSCRQSRLAAVLNTLVPGTVCSMQVTACWRALSEHQHFRQLTTPEKLQMINHRPSQPVAVHLVSLACPDYLECRDRRLVAEKCHISVLDAVREPLVRTYGQWTELPHHLWGLSHATPIVVPSENATIAVVCNVAWCGVVGVGVLLFDSSTCCMTTI